MASRTKRVKIPTPESLNNAALFYLARFAASEASLARVLHNKIRRAAMIHPAFAEDKAAQEKLAAVIETIVKKHVALGVLNDPEYARVKMGSLRRIGKSRRAIQQKLLQKGIAPALIEKSLSEEREDSEEDTELTAARLFAKKKRYTADLSPESRRKAFATFARAGFSFCIAQKILGDQGDDGDDV